MPDRTLAPTCANRVAWEPTPDSTDLWALRVWGIVARAVDRTRGMAERWAHEPELRRKSWRTVSLLAAVLSQDNIAAQVSLDEATCGHAVLTVIVSVDALRGEPSYRATVTLHLVKPSEPEPEPGPFPVFTDADRHAAEMYLGVAHGSAFGRFQHPSQGDLDDLARAFARHRLHAESIVAEKM